MSRKKIYSLTASNFRTFSYSDSNGNVITKQADNVPMLTWPNGRWCLVPNLYIKHLFERGLSRKNRGGTLFTYASYLTHLIQFCFVVKTDFYLLSDNQFCDFIVSLYKENREDTWNTNKRTTSTTIAIGRVCLDFLQFVGNFHSDEHFVGKDGRIQAIQKTIYVSGKSAASKVIARKYWSHRSFPTPSPYTKRFPISEKNIERLRDAVLESSETIFLRKRRYTLLTLLEITGARRSEIVRLTVSSILTAEKMAMPSLRFTTMKKGGNMSADRLVPISKVDLALLVEYIFKNRAAIIRKTCGAKNDDGLLLISQVTGKGLASNTITQEISLLKHVAKIGEKACGHMFRHRFITKLLIALVEQHKLQNSEEFRRALLDMKGMLEIVRELTGHKDISSLDPYIHFAFNQMNGVLKTLDSVLLLNSTSAALRSLEEIAFEIRGKFDAVNVTQQLQSIVGCLVDDIKQAT